MISIIRTRLIHWKKQPFSLLFWLILPILATLAIQYFTSAIQEDSKVPVGIVLEEDTELAMNLYLAIKENPLIRVYDVTEEEARRKVLSHKLDSAFVIEEGYEENVKKGSRNQIITSYKSDLSFAYTPVSQTIISLVQEDTGRSKAAYTVINLDNERSWTWEEIIQTANEIQKEENLLHTTFSYASSEEKKENQIRLWNSWGVWAIFSVLSALMLADWVIKEKRSSIKPRFPFIRFTYKWYYMGNLVPYTVLFLLIDLTAVMLFNLLLSETITSKLLLSMLSFRMMLQMGTFLFAYCFRNLYFYYILSFVLTLFVILISGVIIPMNSSWDVINPLNAFINQEVISGYLMLFTVLLIIWLMKGEKRNA
ncbi:ABC transporter permease [Oceanobacillus piezotolerans]|uniref:ABC transporter permease n=1 Tax=Oceanobacillus piezotolerans TaxID=2448030 RepID=A0A498D9C4_9BACI|nr:ABC transporter permease [Oceanobacillus piezotolerans]RLL47913.1 ABC transporter permease [Oceanobacillus piezotolerans]